MSKNSWIVRYVRPYDDNLLSMVVEIVEGEPKGGDVVMDDAGNRFSVVSLSLGGPPNADRRAIVVEPLDRSEVVAGARLMSMREQ